MLCDVNSTCALSVLQKISVYISVNQLVHRSFCILIRFSRLLIVFKLFWCGFTFQMKKFWMFFPNQLRTVLCYDRMLYLHDSVSACIMEHSACSIPVRHFHHHRKMVFSVH